MHRNSSPLLRILKPPNSLINQTKHRGSTNPSWFPQWNIIECSSFLDRLHAESSMHEPCLNVVLDKGCKKSAGKSLLHAVKSHFSPFCFRREAFEELPWKERQSSSVRVTLIRDAGSLCSSQSYVHAEIPLAVPVTRHSIRHAACDETQSIIMIPRRRRLIDQGIDQAFVAEEYTLKTLMRSVVEPRQESSEEHCDETVHRIEGCDSLIGC